MHTYIHTYIHIQYCQIWWSANCGLRNACKGTGLPQGGGGGVHLRSVARSLDSRIGASCHPFCFCDSLMWLIQ